MRTCFPVHVASTLERDIGPNSIEIVPASAEVGLDFAAQFREQMVELWRGVAAIGVTEMEWTVLATRGEWLTLARALSA